MSVATDVITSPGRIGANDRFFWPPLSPRYPGSVPIPRIHGYASGWYSSTHANGLKSRAATTPPHGPFAAAASDTKSAGGAAGEYTACAHRRMSLAPTGSEATG